MIQFATGSMPSTLAPALPIDELGDAIAELACHLDAATYRLLVMLREFDERNGWSRGFRTCAHWLSWRTGVDLGAAREKVRVARALEALPVLSDAMRLGMLSYSKARALTRIATPENEADLYEVSLHGTAAHIERIVRGWRTVDRLEEAEKEQRQHDQRNLSLYLDIDGTYVIRGRLDPEVGAVLARALEMATEELCGKVKEGRPDFGQQRADALGLLAELALTSASDATASSAKRATRAERFQVVLHVTKSHDSESGECETDDGARVSAETSRRLACDASRVVMTHDERGNVLDVGRRTRTVPPKLRRALERRDRGCRFPGCGVRYCDAHHVTHWADGGATSMENLVLLCRFHHRLVHEDGYGVAVDVAYGPVFRYPDGDLIAEAPLRPAIQGDAVHILQDDHRQAGLTIDAETAPVWSRGTLDLGYAIHVLRRP